MGGAAFVDTAAVLKSLDLVITINSSLAHLAGALGIPTWIALGCGAFDWRWLLDRDNSPWYPTVRLFRQEKAGDWTELMQRIAAEVAKRRASLATGPQPSIITACSRPIGYFWRFYFTLASEGPPVMRASLPRYQTSHRPEDHKVARGFLLG